MRACGASCGSYRFSHSKLCGVLNLYDRLQSQSVSIDALLIADILAGILAGILAVGGVQYESRTDRSRSTASRLPETVRSRRRCRPRVRQLIPVPSPLRPVRSRSQNATDLRPRVRWPSRSARVRNIPSRSILRPDPPVLLRHGVPPGFRHRPSLTEGRAARRARWQQHDFAARCLCPCHLAEWSGGSRDWVSVRRPSRAGRSADLPRPQPAARR